MHDAYTYVDQLEKLLEKLEGSSRTQSENPSEDEPRKIKSAAQAMNLASERRVQWTQHLLLVASTLFGVLISLQRTIPPSPTARLLWAISIALLALSIPSLSLAVLGSIEAIRRAAAAHLATKQDEQKGRFSSDSISGVRRRPFYSFCEYFAYICLIVAVVLLATYSIFSLYACV